MLFNISPDDSKPTGYPGTYPVFSQLVSRFSQLFKNKAAIMDELSVILHIKASVYSGFCSILGRSFWYSLDFSSKSTRLIQFKCL